MVYAAPGEKIYNVIKTHNYKVIPIFSTIGGFFCTLCWVMYGIYQNDYKIYAIQDRFDICEKSHDIEEMKRTVEKLDAINMRDNNGKERALTRFRILIAAYEGNERYVRILLDNLQEKKLRLNANMLQKK